jgi:hypothetical protein
MSWFSKKQAPPLCPGNPGVGTTAKVAFTRGHRHWSEAIDLVRSATRALQARGHAVSVEKEHLVHADSGFTIVPQLANLTILEGGGFQSVTTMQVNHPTLLPAGAFEYQHSTGDTVEQSIAAGLASWVQQDFVVLLDALQPKPTACTMMVMDFPAKDGKPGRRRRAVLGPVSYARKNEPAAPEEHPFCPCCLLTNTFKSYQTLIEGDGFRCLRLLAMRGKDGTIGADCRIDGLDFEVGMEALRAYARTWPGTGFELRKQLVVLHSPPV